MKKIRIAFAGNPNAGKTTLFNTVTGMHLKTGNYAGVTVDKAEAKRRLKDYDITFTDLPGAYSLTSYSPDEMVARDFLLNEKPDVIIDVIDSTNLERNMLLCLQFLELNVPVVAALNMSDEAEAKGISINETLLAKLFGIPFIKTSASSGEGVRELLDAVVAEHEKLQSEKNSANTEQVSTEDENVRRHISYGSEIEEEMAKLVPIITKDSQLASRYQSRWLAVKLLEKDAEANRIISSSLIKDELNAQLGKSITWLERHYGMDCEIIVSEQRYGYIHGAILEAISKKKINRKNVSEQIDKVLMNRFLGLPILLFVFWGIFQLTFAIGEYPMLWLELLFGFVSDGLNSVLPDGFFRSLLVDGILGGVGGVLSFVPLIIILFLFLSILEDVGYMSRAAFIMDKFLHIFGLHGQSFVPMMIGFGCSVPAIMAARTLKNPKDRILTILIVPFMSCGAKLPVYVLFAAAFFPHNAGNVVLSLYVVGVAVSLVISTILSKTIFKNTSTPFVMELPPYRMPTAKGILWHIWNKTWSYAKKAGTVILGASILIWFITTFPQPPVSAQAAIESGGETAIEYSIAGRAGRFIEPVFKPLGFNWKVSIASITGFAAKETVVSTLGILYRTGEGETETSEPLREALQNDPDFSPLVGYIVMLFMLLLPPCFAALATVRAELGGKWLGVSLLLNSAVAWILCFAVYQIGRILL